MKDPITLPGDQDDVAVQLVTKAMRRQRHLLLVKLAECPPEFERLLALRAEAVVLLQQHQVMADLIQESHQAQLPKEDSRTQNHGLRPFASRM